MQRYFLDGSRFSEQSVLIDGEDAHHAVNVMRCRVGDKFICSNGTDREALVQVVEIQKGFVRTEILEEWIEDHEPAVDVWIAQSLPKSDKMETIIQKCTEIGAAKFIPFTSERTIVQYDEGKAEKLLVRWRKIAKEAAEQSHRSRMPAIEGVHTYNQLLSLRSKADLALFCYEHEAGCGLKDALQERKMEFADGKGESGSKPVVLLVTGPEGGFTTGELEKALASGFRPVSLGARVLRTETAAMVGLSCILYENGEMGG